MIVFERVIKRYEEQVTPPVHMVVQYPYTIENQKKLINDLISINRKLDFKKLLELSDNKVHFVFNFLAMLEMLQQQLISIQLGLGFNDFSVESKAATND
jgi:segregation and condensation protein A